MRHVKIIVVAVLIAGAALLSCNRNQQAAGVDKNVPAELSALNQAIGNDGENAGLYLKRSAYYLDHDKLDFALADANRAAALNAGSVEPLIAQSDILLLMGKPQESLDALKKALAINPKDTKVLLKKASLYLVMKDYENLAATVESVLEIDPQSADAYYYKGMALMENEQMDQAIASFERAVEIDQQHAESLMQLGYIWNTRNPKMAIDYFRSASLANPQSTEALYNLGLLYQEQGQPAKAIQSYEGILKIDSLNKLACYNIGYVNLVYLNKYSEAEKSFTRAISLDGAYADAIYNRGLCYEMMKDVPRARADFEQVLKLRVNDAKAVDALNRLDKSLKR